MSDHMNTPLQDGTVPEPLTKAPGQEEIAELMKATPERFAEKVVDVVEDDDDETPQEPQQIRPPKDPNIEWLSYPSIPDQMTRMPHTVRPGPRIDAIFNLSKQDELATFNRIQGEASDHVTGLTTIIYDSEKHFHDGQWHARMTYAKLFYQKL